MSGRHEDQAAQHVRVLVHTHLIDPLTARVLVGNRKGTFSPLLPLLLCLLPSSNSLPSTNTYYYSPATTVTL